MRRGDRRAAELQGRLAAGRRRLATAERRLERLIEMRASDEISAEEYGRSRARVATERDAAQLELAELTAPLDVDRLEAGSWARRLLTSPAEVWLELAGDRRAAFVERVLHLAADVERGAMSLPQAIRKLGGTPYEIKEDTAT